MDFFDIEQAAKAAFADQYTDAYLQHLEATKQKRDIAELLWAAFANGYAAKHEASKSDRQDRSPAPG